jgi:hypothetical protein
MSNSTELLELKIRKKKVLLGVDEFELNIIKLQAKIDKLKEEIEISKQAADEIEIKIQELDKE